MLQVKSAVPTVGGSATASLTAPSWTLFRPSRLPALDGVTTWPTMLLIGSTAYPCDGSDGCADPSSGS